MMGGGRKKYVRDGQDIKDSSNTGFAMKKKVDRGGAWEKMAHPVMNRKKTRSLARGIP